MIEVEMLRPTADEMLSGISADDAMKRRLQFQAHAVDRLAGIAGEMLGDLRATPALRHRILVGASRLTVKNPVRRAAARRPNLARLTPAVSMALVLALMIGLGLNFGAGKSPAVDPSFVNGINTYAAGAQSGPEAAKTPSLFEGEGANPPLICFNGRYYRMLTIQSIPASLRDGNDPIANIGTFTDQPSTVNPVGVFSNIAQVGAGIYSVVGIPTTTAVLAEVNGALRLFQRVGYADNILLGSETLAATIAVSDQIVALELTGVGIIRDETAVTNLYEYLLEFAWQTDGEIIDSDQALTIHLKNGLTLQMAVQEDEEKFGACGTWVCAGFIQEFKASLPAQ